MRFNTYLNEIKGKVEFTGDIDIDKTLKQVEKWRKDLRKLTKIFRSLKYPQDNSDAREWERVKKMFITFRQNFDEWIQKTILTSSTPHEESLYEGQVRAAAHQASVEIGAAFRDGVFRTDDGELELAIDVDKTLKRREAVIRDYNKAFNKVWEQIDKLVKREKEKIKRINRLQKFNYAGVELSIDWGRKERDVEKASARVDDFINNLKNLLERVRKKGLGIVLEDLKIRLDMELNYAGGTYDLAKDLVSISYMNFTGDYRSKVFYHELAHRFWYKKLPKDLQKKWKNAIKGDQVTISEQHIRDFVNKYFPFDSVPGIKSVSGGTDENLRDFFMRNEETVENIAVYSHLAELFDRGFIGIKREQLTKENVIEQYKEDALGLVVDSQFISIYANTNPDEAFAEAVAIWIEHHIGRLPEKVRYILKDMFESMGVRIEESINIELRQWLNESDKELEE